MINRKYYTENKSFTNFTSLRVLATRHDFPNPFMPCNAMYSAEINSCKAIFNCSTCKHNVLYNKQSLFYISKSFLIMVNFGTLKSLNVILRFLILKL